MYFGNLGDYGIQGKKAATYPSNSHKTQRYLFPIYKRC